MDALAAATATAAPVSTVGSHFMLDGNTYKRGAELGFQGLDFYVAGRGGVLGDVDADVVSAAFTFFEPDSVRALWLQGTTVESDQLYGDGRHGTLLGRLQNFWQLSRSTYAQVGFTALGGNGDTTHSRVLGLDLRLTWRPPNAGTRKDLTIRAEGYRLHTDALGETDSKYGAFADVAYRASQRWILGARYDYVETPGLGNNTEWQITPALTWWESEFVFLRLEGQHHHDDFSGNEDRLLLQAVFAMGPHKHETY